MKENELEKKLYNEINDTLGDKLKGTLQINEISAKEKNLKTYLCRFRLDSKSNPMAGQFNFEKHFLEGYVPRNYRVASWSDSYIPSTIISTSYPRGGIIKLSRKYIFVPVYPNTNEFDSDRFYKEKIGWSPLLDILNQDSDLESWLKKMPTQSATRNRKIEINFGPPSNLISSLGQLFPASNMAGKYITVIGFRAIPRWKIGLSGNVSNIDLSYMKYLTMIIQRIGDHIEKFDYKGKVDEPTPSANARLLKLMSAQFIQLNNDATRMKS